MKRLILNLLFILSIGLKSVIAQTVQITGSITGSDDGQPLPGASVVIKGTNIGTTTDVEGKYTLNAPPNAQTLVISFVGLKTQEIEIGGKSVINIAMDRETNTIDEVVVVAYGSNSKRSITGAVTSLDSKELLKQTAISPLRALQGSAPGINVLTTGGQPGEDPTIRIRGIGSVNASADPLIVVDGVVYNGKLSNISSDQIESINTLKDAASASLYGSRAANGVILITTKSGKYNAGTRINFTAKAGVSSPAVKPYKLVGAEDYMKLSWESLVNTGMYVDGNDRATATADATANLVSNLGYNPYSVDNPVDVNGNIVNGATLLWDTDWYNELIRKNAAYHEYSVGIQGGSDKIIYSFSGSYLKQQGSVIESDFDRFAFRVNMESKVTKWLTAGVDASYSKSIQNYPDQSGGSYTSTMQWVNTIASIYPLYARDDKGTLIVDENGNYIYDYGNQGGGQPVNAVRPLFGGENAVSSTRLNQTNYKRNSLFSNVYFNINIYKGLSFKTTVGYENYTFNSFVYDHYKYGAAANVKGRISQGKDVTESYTVTNDLKYKNTFGKHGLNVDLISEVYNYNYNNFNAQATGYLPNVYVLSGSTKPEFIGGYINEERLISYLGRVEYSFSGRYNLSVSYRRDGSTRFAPENRWGNFYSVGANWIISDESFLKGNPVLSLAKLRVSYGELGNNRGIGYFPYLQSFLTGHSNGENTGVILGNVVDKNITWEKTGAFDVGLDFGLFKDRITGTVDYYNKKSIDLIFDKPLSPSTGNISVSTNIGSLRNSGWEFSLTTKNIVSKDFDWTTSFNLSTNKNEILSLPQNEIIRGTKKLMVGHSIYDFFIQRYAGVDPADGYAMWYKDVLDAGGNVTGTETTKDYTEATRYYSGSSLPKYYGGFSTDVRYKAFDLNVMFNYSVGGKIYDASYANLMSAMDSPGQQVSIDIKGRWQKPGDVTDIPMLLGSQNDFNQQSDRFLFRNNYLRLKALNFGYNLPVRLIHKWSIAEARLYLQADNIWTGQSHKGLDPEQDLAGTTDSRSYLMKSYSFGINVTF